ncbi:MAG: glucosaminidase domain-containing protein [Prevotella sp.]|nr:glucosaminidase domain-containing protein [Candidatus Prevotella equi]
MIRTIYTVIILLCAIHSSAQIKWNSTYQAYIDRYKDIAIEQMLTHKIPASITLAQGLLESGAGRSTLSTQGNNHFGIKCHDWTGRKLYKDDDEKNDCFRVYSNVRESYEDHSRFLKKPRYDRLFTLSTQDYKGWAKGLKACGYATSPTYAQQLINIIELYQLHKYDKATSFDKYLAEHSGANTSGHTPTHKIEYCNKNYYIVAKHGDTFKSLSKEVGVKYSKLAKYNELSKNAELSDGDIIYLLKKRTKADKSFKNKPHIIKAGESMYSISQTYGIRVKNLYKLNHLDPDYSPKVGDKLRVY